MTNILSKQKLAGLALLVASSFSTACHSPKLDQYSLTKEDYKSHPMVSNLLDVKTDLETVIVPAHRIPEILIDNIPYAVRPLPNDTTIKLEERVITPSGLIIEETILNPEKLGKIVLMPTNYSERHIKDNSITLDSTQPFYLVEIARNKDNDQLQLNLDGESEQREVLFRLGSVPEKFMTEPYEITRQRIVDRIERQIPNASVKYGEKALKLYLVQTDHPYAKLNSPHTLNTWALVNPSFDPYIETRGDSNTLKVKANSVGYALVHGKQIPSSQYYSQFPVSQPSTQPSIQPAPEIESIK